MKVKFFCFLLLFSFVLVNGYSQESRFEKVNYLNNYYFYDQALNLKFEAKATYAGYHENDVFYTINKVGYNDFTIAFFNEDGKPFEDYLLDEPHYLYNRFRITNQHGQICFINQYGSSRTKFDYLKFYTKKDDQFIEVEYPSKKAAYFIQFEDATYSSALDTFETKEIFRYQIKAKNKTASNLDVRDKFKLLNKNKNHRNQVHQLKPIENEIVNKRNIDYFKDSLKYKNGVVLSPKLNYNAEYINFTHKILVKNEGGKFYLSNKEKKILFENSFDEIGKINISKNLDTDLIYAKNINSKNTFYFNSEGKHILKKIKKLDRLNTSYFITQNRFSNNSKKAKFGLATSEGKVVFPCVYDKIEKAYYKDNWFTVVKNGKYGIVDDKNNFIVKPKILFNSQIYEIQKACLTDKSCYKTESKKIIALNKKINTIVSKLKADSLSLNEFESYSYGSKEFFKIALFSTTNKKYEVLANENGEILIPPKYHSLQLNNRSTINCAHNVNFYDIESESFLFKSDAVYFSNNFCVFKDSSAGFVNLDTKEINYTNGYNIKMNATLLKNKKHIYSKNKLYDLEGNILKTTKGNINFSNPKSKYLITNAQFKQFWDVKSEKLYEFADVNEHACTNLIKVTNKSNKHALVNQNLDTLINFQDKNIQLFEYGFIIENKLYDKNSRKIIEVSDNYRLDCSNNRLHVFAKNSTNKKSDNNAFYIFDEALNFYDYFTLKTVEKREIEKLNLSQVMAKKDGFVKIDSFKGKYLWVEEINPDPAKEFVSYKIVDTNNLEESTVLDLKLKFLANKIQFDAYGNVKIITRDSKIDKNKNEEILLIYNSEGNLIYRTKKTRDDYLFNSFVDGYMAIRKDYNKYEVIDTLGNIDTTKKAITVFYKQYYSALLWQDEEGIHFPPHLEKTLKPLLLENKPKNNDFVFIDSKKPTCKLLRNTRNKMSLKEFSYFKKVN